MAKRPASTGRFLWVDRSRSSSHLAILDLWPQICAIALDVCYNRQGFPRIGRTHMARKSPATKKSPKRRPAYHRILLKLSGESMQGPQGFGIDGQTIYNIAHELREVHNLGVQVAIMVGGGNIFRGSRQKGFEIDRATGDYMGMLATVLNALALQDALEKSGVNTRVQSAIEMHQVCEPFIRRRATRHLKKGASSFSPPAPAILISPRTRLLPFAPWKSRPT